MWKRAILAVVWCQLLLSFCVGNKIKLECEKRCHSSLNPTQRTNLCHQEEYSLGPAACSVMAKESLHSKYEDMLALCREAPSAAPVECMLELDTKGRSEFGTKICRKASSTLPSECFRRLTVGKKGPREAVAKFCQGVVDHAPILCAEAAQNHTSMKLEDILPLCKVAVGSGEHHRSHDMRNSLSSNCISALHHLISPSQGVTAKDLVEFCVHVNPHEHDGVFEDEAKLDAFKSSAIDCVLTMQTEKNTLPVKLHLTDILNLCHNAPVAQGPVNCTKTAIESLAAKEPTVKLTAATVVALCRTAENRGPAECLVESKSLGTMEERAHLCNSAVNSGPALCYRRAASTFRNAPTEHQTLCVMAESEGPAECAASAPHYLVPEEKVHLCMNAPVSGYNSPSRCLQLVHTHSKNFAHAPKRALGYFQENLQLDSEWTSRALLVSMCSFSDSQDPLAAAECYKSVPTTLHHDDAVRLCTNISSTSAIQFIQLCQRILPRTWSSEASSVLCEGLDSRKHTESVVQCAVDLARLQTQSQNAHMGFTDVLLSQLCRSTSAEHPTGVSKCVQRALALSSTATTLLGVNASTIAQVCTHSVDATPADCVHDLAQTLVTSQQSVDRPLIAKLCKQHRQNYASLLRCLKLTAGKKRLVDEQDLQRCIDTPRAIDRVTLQRMYSIDDDLPMQVTAGKRFALWFEVLDQYHEKYDDANVHVKISIHDSPRANGGEGGAILWGYRTNVTRAGVLHYASLIISQSGPVEVRLTLVSDRSSSKRTAEQTIAVFQLDVLADPVMTAAMPCLYLLRDASCAADSLASDHDALFPLTRSVALGTASHYMWNIHCADLVSTWGLRASLAANAALHVEYRQGVESLWTGIGLPRQEMTALQKLGLALPAGWTTNSPPSSKDVKLFLKQVKRAYYRASLQWHPDRWVGPGLERYGDIVQGVFQLIHEAYEAVQAQVAALPQAQQEVNEEELASMEQVFA